MTENEIRAFADEVFIEHEPVDHAIEESLDVDREQKSTWRIENDDAAEWALRKIRKAQQDIDSKQTLAQLEITAVEAWLDRVTQRLARDVEFFTAKLHEYHEAVLADDPRRKTIDLPAGTSQIRAGTTSLEVENADTAIAWLEDHLADPSVALRYRTELNKTNVKSLFGTKVGDDAGDYPLVTADGEVIPGAKIRRNVPTHKVTVT